MAENTERSWTAYHRGQAARMRGVPYKANPYKVPTLALNWSLGWVDWKKSHKGFPAMRKRAIKHLKTVR
jgi:hypothetical protein